MTAPSPIHRDPDRDGDNFGCIGRQAAKGNLVVYRLVNEVIRRLKSGEFKNGDEFFDFVQCKLEHIDSQYDCGICDTIVKENMFAALRPACIDAGLRDIDWKCIYGW
jgi:hypothetical protein